MRLRQLDADHWIAEGIDLIDAAMHLGSDFDLVLETLLVRRGPRHQVQQVVRVHDVGAVHVAGLMADSIAALHVASACASDSMSAK